MPYSSTSALPPAVKSALKTTKERQAFVSAFNAALKQGRTEEEAFKIAYAAARNARGKKKDSAMRCEPCDRNFVTDTAFESHLLVGHDEEIAAMARAEVAATPPPGDNAPKAPPGAPPPATGTGEQPSGGSLHLKLALEHMRMFAASETQDARKKSALMLLRPMKTLVEDSSPAPGAAAPDPNKPGAQNPPAAKKAVAKKATSTQSPGARGGSQSRTGSRPAAKVDPKRKVKVSVEAAMFESAASMSGPFACREDDGCGRVFVSQGRLVEHAEAVHTHGDIRQMVQAALRMKIEAARPMGYANSRVYVYVADIADDWVVYEVGEGMYKSSYSIKDKVVTLGDAKPVRSRRVYEEIKVGV